MANKKQSLSQSLSTKETQKSRNERSCSKKGVHSKVVVLAPSADR